MRDSLDLDMGSHRAARYSDEGQGSYRSHRLFRARQNVHALDTRFMGVGGLWSAMGVDGGGLRRSWRAGGTEGGSADYAVHERATGGM